jgi:transcriptional regulator with XRE-family HTH domain
MRKTIDKSKQSSFISQANYRLQNNKWLRYSGNISRRILAALEDAEDIDRNTLAARLGVSMQYNSKLVQGQENLSLQTISKISEALGIELITFPEYKYSKKQASPKPFISKVDQQTEIIDEVNKKEAAVKYKPQIVKTKKLQ